jgi:hypothetical protein
VARRTRTFLITAVAAVAALIPAASASAGTLDQQQTLSNFGGLQVDSNNSKAQTFTAGLTGQLDQVDLAVSGMSVTTPLTVQIRDGSATAPGDTVLASASVPTSAVTSSESFVPITFASPASVTAGTQYSIVELNDSSGWFWYAGKTDTASAYEGGRLYSSPNGPPGTGPWFEGNVMADFEFKTYVAPPPPFVEPPPPFVEPPPSGPGAATTSTCKGAQATIVGTPGNDVRSGTPGRDVMVGLAGNDRLSGLAGKDLICGGPGKDTLKGGKGADSLLGQTGKDTLNGGGGKDICKGGKRNDTASKCEVEKSI